MFRYEYRCRRCGRYFDEKRDMERRNDPAECPKCGGPALRHMTAPEILWGGSWAVRANPNDPEQWK